MRERHMDVGHRVRVWESRRKAVAPRRPNAAGGKRGDRQTCTSAYGKFVAVQAQGI